MASKTPRKRWLKWLLIIPLLIVAFYGIMGFVFSGAPTQKELNDKFIVVNPLDLSQISGFSKYRSCMGHDYRAPLAKTGKKESSPRSMKHYIKVKEELMGKNDVVKAIAPFNGKISAIEKRDSERTPDDQQIWLSPDKNNSASPRDWNFVFFHINLRDDLKEGSKVNAGEVIGTAKLSRGPENSTDNFDMAVKFTRPMAVPALDEVFPHMSDGVLAEYAERGVTPENVVISEEFRDQNHCPTIDKVVGGDVYFSPNTDPSDMLFLQ